MTRRTTRAALAVLAAGALLAAACGTDDTSDADDPDGLDSAATTTEPADTNTDAGDASDDDAGETDEGAAAPPRPSAGCGTTEVGAVRTEERTIDVDGTERWYLLTTPEEHDGTTPLPVVISFHGLMEGAIIHAEQSGFDELATEEGFVAVFPNGTGEPLRWNIADGENPDLDFVDALVAEVGEELCVDEGRRYASGLSNGAMMTSLVACARPGLVAAVAPVAGVTDIESCEPDRPIPLLAFHGTDDTILLFNGGVNVAAIPGLDPDAEEMELPEADLDGDGYPATVAAWAANNGCDEASDVERTDEVVERVYDCPEGADVEFVIVVGGGHSWPGSEFSERIAQIVGMTTFDADAAAEAWAFFQRFSLP
ncbi:MAG: prolyl oligopeptidase family serine peptidase [Acidimicrobiia bacterium]|nr:prolyl oligopeptidase family serine peptidase [Acidimicrobiia bacterium]